MQVCDSDPANSDCSLRGAINRAHANGGTDTITFAIPDTDPGYVATTAHWRFTPASEYPYVTDDLIIDGYSQPGAEENTQTPEQGGSNATLKIELRGPGVSAQSTGLHAVNGDARLTLRGVAINRFQTNLQLWTPGPHHVEGCFIGTDITGMLAAESTNGSGIGIRLNGQLIAGDGTPASRNVISGNPYIGIWDDRNSAHSTIQGNLIGTNAAGTAALPGQDYGIYAVSIGNGALVGGSDPSQRNLISGNTIGALNISPQISGANSQPYRVVGNFIGTDFSGTLPIGNGINPQSPSQPQPSISVFGLGSCGLEIGGDGAGEGNLIGFGGREGILVNACDRAPIIGNRFVLNRGVAIDLSTSNADIGPTPNDPGDADANPPPGGGAFLSGNRLQNSPEILALVYSGNYVTLTYRVDTDVANATYPLRIDIARGRAGQAEFPVAIDSYGAIDAGLPKSITFPASALAGGALVLSATDAAGNTSEFGGEHLFADSFE
ncbi:MAG: hypothetical protein IPP82_12995 [Xanthomonadales bacterium]|nr:hypothetical protein [Xanthomonadales bacterium]